MVVVLLAAGAFVYWRVEFALDHRLGEDLRTQTSDLRQAARTQRPAAALSSLRDQAREAQLLTPGGTVLASGPGIAAARPLLTPAQARRAAQGELQTERGHLFSARGQHLRMFAIPVRGNGPATVAVTAVRLDQRDEALRELLAQLTIANLRSRSRSPPSSATASRTRRWTRSSATARGPSRSLRAQPACAWTSPPGRPTRSTAWARPSTRCSTRRIARPSVNSSSSTTPATNSAPR
jgi:hypothetical protein